MIKLIMAASWRLDLLRYFIERKKKEREQTQGTTTTTTTTMNHSSLFLSFKTTKSQQQKIAPKSSTSPESKIGLDTKLWKLASTIGNDDFEKAKIHFERELSPKLIKCLEKAISLLYESEVFSDFIRDGMELVPTEVFFKGGTIQRTEKGRNSSLEKTTHLDIAIIFNSKESSSLIFHRSTKDAIMKNKKSADSIAPEIGGAFRTGFFYFQLESEEGTSCSSSQETKKRLSTINANYDGKNFTFTLFPSLQTITGIYLLLDDMIVCKASQNRTKLEKSEKNFPGIIHVIKTMELLCSDFLTTNNTDNGDDGGSTLASTISFDEIVLKVAIGIGKMKWKPSSESFQPWINRRTSFVEIVRKACSRTINLLESKLANEEKEEEEETSLMMRRRKKKMEDWKTWMENVHQLDEEGLLNLIRDKIGS